MTAKSNTLKLNNIFFDAINRNILPDRILTEIPHFDYLDISVIFYHDVNKKHLITNDDLKMLHLSKNQLFKIAKTNMQIKYPVNISTKEAKDGTLLFYEMSNSLNNPLSCIFYDNSKKSMKNMGKITYFSDFSRSKITFFTEQIYENKDELNQILKVMYYAGRITGEYTNTPSVIYKYDSDRNKLTYIEAEYDVLDEEKDFLEY